LLNVLQKHTTTIPSGFDKHIPFYDDVKIKAAIAVCLKEYETSGGDIEEDTALLLVGGSISGIQDFIYDIISKNASKNLKGRSFYLQMIVDTVLQKVLAKLNLYQANIIYASGGGFFILAPNTSKVKHQLASLEQEIADKLFKVHQTQLFLAMG